jgi:hypothetical protein
MELTVKSFELNVNKFNAIGIYVLLAFALIGCAGVQPYDLANSKKCKYLAGVDGTLVRRSVVVVNDVDSATIESYMLWQGSIVPNYKLQNNTPNIPILLHKSQWSPNYKIITSDDSIYAILFADKLFSEKVQVKCYDDLPQRFEVIRNKGYVFASRSKFIAAHQTNECAADVFDDDENVSETIDGKLNKNVENLKFNYFKQYYNKVYQEKEKLLRAPCKSSQSLNE